MTGMHGPAAATAAAATGAGEQHPVAAAAAVCIAVYYINSIFRDGFMGEVGPGKAAVESHSSQGRAGALMWMAPPSLLPNRMIL